jgi:Ras-related protein Rab-2A
MNENELDYEILSEDISQVNFSFKIIVIGDSSVGKSSLTLRATKNHFKDIYTPTIGFEFLSFNIKIKNQTVKLQIWDTCGQEVYRSLISSFYRNSSLAIIVYAIDNQESFDNLESWLDEIKSQTHPNLRIFLIGNKADLEDQRLISKKAAEELVKDHNIDLFMETSAKTGSNAQEVFVKAAKMLLEDYKKYSENEGRDSNFNGDKSSISLSAQENEKENEISNDNEDKIRRKKCC